MVRTRRVYAFCSILVCVTLSASLAAGVEVIASRDLNFVGDAQMMADWVRINHSAAYVTGAFWYDEQVAVQSGFVTQFRFAITEQGGAVHPTEGTDGADGLVFVIQNHSDNAIGGTGCNLGYDGIPNSVAVEFDTWWNGIDWGPPLDDPNGYHISVHTRGTEPNSVHEEYSLGCVSYPELVTIDEHTVKVSYQSGSLEIYIDDMINPILAIEVNISEVLDLAEGRAWLGFTGSTGSAWENHDILDWRIEGNTVANTIMTWGRVKALYR